MLKCLIFTFFSDVHEVRNKNDQGQTGQKAHITFNDI
jgi:hypothetical protein